MIEDFPIEEEAQEVIPKVRKRAGRKPGTKNTPADFKHFKSQFESVYRLIEPMMTNEQRKYYEDVFTGKTEFDAFKSMGLLLRLLEIYNAKVLTTAIQEGKVSESLAQTVAQFRMGLKDYEDINRKREELRIKNGDDAGLVNTTLKPEIDRFESLHRKSKTTS